MSRLPSGGRVDRSDPLRFVVDGVPLTGLRGDTLASALIAADHSPVAPSWRSGRPRGIVGAGIEEPNALVEVLAPYQDSLVPATVIELVEGLRVRTCAAVGRLSVPSVPARYDHSHLHVDVLVIGGGPAGLAAADAASAGGARVLLVDDQPELGGRLLSDRERLDGALAQDWVASTAATLAGRPHARVLTRATAIGRYHRNLVLVLQRRTDHLDRPAGPGVARQRLWHVRAREVVVATGALERPLVFAGNDRPGIMLASAVRGYLNRWAAVPGRRAAVVTTDDSGYLTAVDLLAAGVPVIAIADTRRHSPVALARRLTESGVRVLAGSAVVGTEGGDRLSAVQIAPLADTAGGEVDPTRLAGPAERIEVDLLAVAGGWTPQLQLSGPGHARWDDDVAGYLLPAGTGRPAAGRTVGAAAGTSSLAGCLAEGAAAGAAAAEACGYPVRPPIVPPVLPQVEAGPPPERPRPVWLVPSTRGTMADWDQHVVDAERDATVADVWRAIAAGMRSVEHVKRHTTIGTGRDQGRTSGVNLVGLVALATGNRPMSELATSASRPPVVPVPFAAFAGRHVGRLSDPRRTTPMHAEQVAAGARFEVVGQWLRARSFPRPEESGTDAVLRECRAARTGVAMMDVSTLGKIEVVGADAPRFLDRIYTNAFSGLAVGAGRYGVMCTADGMVLDDGVSLRLAPDRYLMTTTTGNAARVLNWLEEWHQTEWPELQVTLTSVTEQWATLAVVGPGSRGVLGRLAPELDVSAEAFGFMAFRSTRLGSGIPARIARISFSGELAYEISVASWFGAALWRSAVECGADLDVTPYGTDAMHVLRAEKGYPIIGQDTDGTVTPDDLGLGWAVSRRKDFVGRRSLTRPDMLRPDRKHLVGLLPDDPGEVLPEGAQLIADQAWPGSTEAPMTMIGHVTSSYRSAALGRGFALALIAGGRARVGSRVLAPLADRVIGAIVVPPVFYDVEGARRDG